MVFCHSGSTSLRTRVRGLLSFSAIVLGFLLPAAFGATATTTTFTITANGVPLTVVDTHSTVKLTAEVKAGSSKVTTGQVSFCDAAFKHSCLDFRQVGTVQVTKNGTASLRFIPGPGEHRYKAVFLGTTTHESSSSDVSTLTVQGGPAPHVTRTTLSASGSKGSYTLMANVTAPASALPLVPGGLVFFQDRSDSDKVLGQANLPVDAPAVNYTGVSQPLSQTLSNGNPVGGGLAVGDFNGDGKPDVVVCKNTACPAVELGNGDGTFREPPSQPAPISSVYRAKKGDFNSDGILDLIVTHKLSEAQEFATLLFRGAGDGTFLPPTKIRLKTAAGSFGIVEGVEDFNKDGIPDLLVNYIDGPYGYTSSVGVVFGKGDGTFTSGWTYSEPDVRWYSPAAIGDFDGDGFKDFAVSGSDFDDDEFLSIFFGSSDGSFTEKQINDYGIFDLVAGDFNGDGRTELAESGYSYDFGNFVPGFRIDQCHPDRTFTYRYASGAEPRYDDSTAILIDDFNRDGIADVALVGELSYFTNKYVQIVLLGNQDGSFTQVTRSQSPTPTSLQSAYIFGTADFNGDGIPDVAATGTQANTGYEAYGAFISQVGQTAVASIIPPIGAGSHEVVARYRGDVNFVTSVSKRVMLTAPSAGSPIATLSSNYVQFGEQPVSEPSNAKTVVLTNTGTGALLIGNISIETGDGDNPLRFAVSNNCPASLAAGDACKIRSRFVPGSPGAKKAFLSITDNAGNSPQTIVLSGVGVKTR